MDLTINTEREEKRIIVFIQEVFRETGHKKAVIACSGGIDSSVTATLLVKALGKENVYALFLPYKDLNPQGLKMGKEIVEFLGLPEQNISTIDISSEVDSFAKLVTQEDAIRFGNVMARVRMIVLYDFAKKLDALVSGTENKTESYLGYFTRFGDEASDFEPIRHLYKTQIFQLAKHLGLPEQIIMQSPTAGLWHGQTDEEEFGFTYKEADVVLHAFYEQKKTLKEIESSSAQAIIQFAKRNEYKHHVPYTLDD